MDAQNRRLTRLGAQFRCGDKTRGIRVRFTVGFFTVPYLAKKGEWWMLKVCCDLLVATTAVGTVKCCIR